jgi:hypothetical protein
LPDSKESKPFNGEILGGGQLRWFASPLAAKPAPPSSPPPSGKARHTAGGARFASSGPLLPRLQLNPCGFFFPLIIAAAFCAGKLRQELALSLLGAVLLSAWTYSLILGLVIALIHRRGALLIQTRLAPRSIAAGEEVEIFHQGGRFFRIPGILIRCRLRLETRDGRRLEHSFDPRTAKGSGSRGSLAVPRRGAYYSGGDELAVFDAFGFFRFSWPLPREEDARILAGPRPAEEILTLNPQPGGREQRSGPHYRRTDDLIEHRPYIPGDDPRRINWKLYSHGPANALFVREGETEPPPRSRLLILADTEADPDLYDPPAAREEVDLLCAQVLALCLDLSRRGMDVLSGYTGGSLQGGDGAALAQALAWPAALPLPGGRGASRPWGLPWPWTLIRRALGFGPRPIQEGSPPELPSAEWGTCILALPRTSTGGGRNSSALDRFLSRSAGETDIIFVYSEDPRRRESAGSCARLYGSRNGVRAFALALPGGPAGFGPGGSGPAGPGVL